MKPILDLNAFDASEAGGLGADLERIVQRRRKAFGAASVLFYAKPLQFVRGQDCWLYTEDGTAFLDAYNNVPSVGHSHPAVVDAAARQMRELNVHSRYLHRIVLEYAEQLIGHFTPELSNITFNLHGAARATIWRCAWQQRSRAAAAAVDPGAAGRSGRGDHFAGRRPRRGVRAAFALC